MSNNVRTKLELLENGPSMPRKQSKKRRPYKKKEQEQELNIQGIDDIEPIPMEEQKIVFRPNKGPQTEFLAAPEREVLYGGSAGGGK